MPDAACYAFGPFRLDAAERTLSRDGRPVRLTPKDLGVLLALVQRHGSLVDRERLFAQVWPGVIVEDCNLARHVATLRQALGDLADSPTYIETLPKRGYRFVAPVTVLEREANDLDRVEPRRADQPPRQQAPLLASEAESGPPPAPPEGEVVTSAAQAAPAADPSTLGRGRWGRLAFSLPRTAVAAGGVALLTGALLSGGQLAGASGPIRSLAVLPIANLTGDPGQDHLAEALAEMMVNDLGRRRELQLVSRGSARRYAGSLLTARQIGRELEVDGLLEASIVQAGARVRVTSEIVDARTNKLVWAEVFEGDTCDVMELQDLIVAAAVEALGLQPEPPRPVAEARALHPGLKGLACQVDGEASAAR